jgi:uncharacterized membrane protein YeiH
MGAVWHTLNLAGTAVFAISGAAIGVKYRLDVFGVCVLAFVAGNAGGMLRDVMLGATARLRSVDGITLPFRCLRR